MHFQRICIESVTFEIRPKRSWIIAKLSVCSVKKWDWTPKSSGYLFFDVYLQFYDLSLHRINHHGVRNNRLFSWILNSLGPIGGNPCLIVIWLSWWVPESKICEMSECWTRVRTMDGWGQLWYDSVLGAVGGNQTKLITIVTLISRDVSILFSCFSSIVFSCLP